MNCVFENLIDTGKFMEIRIEIFLVDNVDQTKEILFHVVILLQFSYGFFGRHVQIKGWMLLNSGDKFGAQH